VVSVVRLGADPDDDVIGRRSGEARYAEPGAVGCRQGPRGDADD